MSTKKSILLLLGISIVVYFKWLLPGHYFGGDWPYYPSVVLHDYFNLPMVWSPLMDFGSVDLTLWRYPLYFIYGLFSLFSFDSSSIDKIIIFWPTIILGNISIFYLAKKVTKSSLAGFFASLVFNYNTYIFEVNTAFLLYSAVVWMIISFILFIYSLEGKKVIFSMLTAISLFITGIFDIRMVYISFFLFSGYLLYYIGIIKKINSLKQIIKYSISGIIPFSLFTVFSLYWILPLIFSDKFVSNALLERGLFGNDFLNILYAITLFHPFWAGTSIIAFSSQPILFYFWVIPILAFLGIFLGKKNRNILFFGIIAFVGIFLTKQVGEPFSYIYTFLFQHFPGFAAFREASKFYFLVALGFSILVGYAIDTVVRAMAKKSFGIYKKLLLIILFVIFMGNILPFYLGTIGLSKAFVEPKEYSTINQFIFGQPDSFRVLWLPWGSQWSSQNYTKTSFSGAGLYQSEWSEFYKQSATYDPLYLGKLITNSFSDAKTKNIVSLYSMKYIIVPDKNEVNDIDIFGKYGKKRQQYINVLNKAPYLKSVNTNTKNVAVYINTLSKPHVYVTYKEETVNTYIPFEKVNYIYNNPTKYTIFLKNTSKPFYLNFSDTYNPNWKLKSGNFNWIGSLYDKNYFLSVKHFANAAGFNSFYISPKQVCAVQTNCTINADGTYNLQLTLYFKPQSYLYFGLIISGITLIGTIVVVVILGIKEVKIRGRKN